MKRIVAIMFAGVFFLLPATSWSAPPFDLIATLQALQTQVAALQATVADLQSQVATLQAGTVANLGKYVSVDDTANRITVLGANLQIVNGTGSTFSVNGKGNLIIGYDKMRINENSGFSCSDGKYNNQTECNIHNEVWAINHKSGSHNLVIGDKHNYSRAVGFVAGDSSTINGDVATVIGGGLNTAYRYSSIFGAHRSNATGFLSTVCGGSGNTASGGTSTVCGGGGNIASGQSATVSGGASNTASGYISTVSGGEQNISVGDTSSTVCGGYFNTASGRRATVVGGSKNTASGEESTARGGYNNTVSIYRDYLP